jgi:eukaryotic-like serine/threonine-protein kinase
MNEESVFLEALQVPTPEERVAFLERVCSGNPNLRRGVQMLLRAHEKAGHFMQTAPCPGSTADERATERPGAVIGPYKLLQQIGEGGFGTVFMAEQTEPVRRKVALKVIKPGMDTKQVIARFEAERQALAMMDHLNIARVLDVGATDAGLPYFVMELVHGVPITKYCDDNRLTPRERLELFVPVCQALQHAHQKGIIHRDIKPSNVMVTLYDGKPVPKVIDFGVAKATEQRLTEQTLFTQYGSMIGTFEYMSPEQAEMSALGADTRSDIFSLGVLLYELLTGSTPLSRKRVKDAAYGEILRMIKEEEPPRPSTRLSDSGEALASISAQRHMEPAKLTKLVRGELDWIVMKCLEKDRNRRYETPHGLALDIQRYLDDEPVQAYPPSAMYRFRKFARRHRVALATTGLVALALVLGTVVSAWQAVRGTRAEGLAQTRLEAETEARKQADDALQQAKTNYDLAEERAAQIRRDLERLKAANAALDRGRWYVGEQRWDDAQIAFTKAIELRPDHASAWVERSDLHTHLGLWDLAAADFAGEFELREPDLALRWYCHALLRLYVGDADGYRQVCRRMRERFRGTKLPHFAAYAVRTSLLAPDADAEFARLLEQAQNALATGPADGWVVYTLGLAHYRAGQHEQAIRRLREPLAGVAGWPARAISYPVLAMAHHRLGQTAEARQALDQAAKAIDQWARDMYQSQRGHWVNHLGAGAIWPIAWCDWLECQLFYREAKALIDGSPPPEDPRLRVLRARALAGLRWNTKADVEYAEAMKLVPHDSQVHLEAHRNRGYCCVGLRQWSQAAAEFARASEMQPDDTYLWHFRAEAHLAAGEVAAYREACAAMVERFKKTGDARKARNVVVACVLRDDALPDMARLVPLARVAVSAWYRNTDVLGAALYRARKYDEAVRCFETAANAYPPEAWDWSFLAMAHHRLGHAAEARRCLAEAAHWIDEANRQNEDDLSGTRPTWGDWHRPVEFPLLFHEAEVLLGEREKKN